MSKTAATEKDVGTLHSIINKLYTNVGRNLLEGLDSEDETVRALATEACSPAMLTSMSNWVKQNSITCQPEEVEQVIQNKELLKQKRRRGSAKASISYIDPLLDPTGTNEK